VAAASVSVPTPPPVTVVPGVRIHPEPGWVVGKQAVEGGIKVVRLTSGAGNLDVLAANFEGDSAALLELYLENYLKPDAQQLEVSNQRDTVTTPSGVTGVRLHYVGVFGERSQGIEGEVTAFVTASGVGVAFDAWAGQGQLDLALDDVHRMIDSAELS
jgi:hypothetical protein